MENEKDYIKDLSEIRSMMERSSRFISLSGLAGVMAGVYALMGAFAAYRIIYFSPTVLYDHVRQNFLAREVVWLVAIALAVLISTIGTGIYFTTKKAKRHGLKVWDASAKRLIINLIIPLASGGMFVAILFYRGYFGVLASATLLFYGLGLINASKYTLTDVRYLGMAQIVVGLLAATLPGYSLMFWAIGFGFLHILYGLAMYFKYES